MSVENVVTSTTVSPPSVSKNPSEPAEDCLNKESHSEVPASTGDATNTKVLESTVEKQQNLAGDEKLFSGSEAESEVSSSEEFEESENENATSDVRGDSRVSKRSRSYRPGLRGRRYTQGSFNRGGNFHASRRNLSQQRYKAEKARNEDGSNLFLSNWGHRSNLIDLNGNIQRATNDLKNYIAYYKAKYYYYFDLVNGRYPQFVRKFENNLEIWRMSFNVYASGFSDLIVHLGEVHAFYQMEFVENELRWVYKDFNFYPNKMRYGFRVNSYDIADIHSRFIKFICIRENIIKRFPYVSIKHKNFIYRKFEENLQTMLNRLNEVSVEDKENASEVGASVVSIPPTEHSQTQPNRKASTTQPHQSHQHNQQSNESGGHRVGDNDGESNGNRRYRSTYRPRPHVNRRGMNFTRRGGSVNNAGTRPNYRN